MVAVTYVLNTDVISEPLKPSPNARLLERLNEHHAHLAITSVTWHEALFGMQRLAGGARRRKVEDYLWQVIHPSMRVLPYDDLAAAWHAAERARLASAGLTPPFADGQIAAIAFTNECVLVTANVDDFQRFDGLRVENWLSE